MRRAGKVAPWVGVMDMCLHNLFRIVKLLGCSCVFRLLHMLLTTFKGTVPQDHSVIRYILNGQCHEIYDHFLKLVKKLYLKL